MSRRSAPRLVPSDVDGSRSRRLATWALEIWALSAFAIAQPLFSLLGDEATFFVVHRASASRIVALVLVLVFVVPAALFALDCLVEVLEVVVVALWRRLSGSKRSRTVDDESDQSGDDRYRPRISPIVHTVVLGVLAAAVVVPPLSRAIDAGAAVWMTGLVIVAVAVAVLVARFVVIRRFVRYAAFAPVLFAVLFLFFSPVSGLVTGADTAAANTTTDDDPGTQRSIIGSADADTPPVVWMVLDEFALSMIVDHDGEIVADRFPNLARLASMSTFYPAYTAGTVFTEQAVPALLTGRWPNVGQLPIASQQPESLFTIMSGSAYPVTAYESLTELCPTDICEDRPEPKPIPLWGDTWAVYLRYLLPDSVADRFVGRIDQNWADFGRVPGVQTATGDPDSADGDNADTGAAPTDAGDGSTTTPTPSTTTVGDTAGSQEGLAIDDERTHWAELAEAVPDFNGNVDLFDRFVRPLAGPGLQGLHYLHMRLPHVPVRYLPDGRKYVADFEPRTGDLTRWPDDEPTMRTLMHRAVIQAMFADHLVGRMLDALEASGNLEGTVIVVASDHGGSLRPGVATRSMDEPDPALDSVPSLLLIKGPSQSLGRVDLRRAQQVDVLPTVLELADIDPYDPELKNEPGFDGLAMTERHDAEWAHRIVVRAGDGNPVEYVDPPVVTESPTIDWIRRILPDPTRPYAVGPLGDVVGQRVDAADRSVSRYSIIMDSPEMFDDVTSAVAAQDPDRTPRVYVPALITGVIDGATSGVHVAAVVNGHVAGVGESYGFYGPQRISILIYPESLRPGHNDVWFMTVPVGATPTGPDDWELLPVNDGS